MTPVRLSIGIPTYNFGAFIGDTLASIVPQLEPGVEVVILDGGSTDNTAEAVRPFVDTHPQITYYRQDRRGGIDRDMARTAQLARGEYVWLFSSDDLMKPGALRRVLAEIESGLDVYLCGLTLCDDAMKPLHDHTVSEASWGSTFQLREVADRARYFALAQTTTAVFSFMGSMIFRRARWNEQTLDEAYVGSCWAHVVRFLRMIPNGLHLKFLGEPLQWKRGDNDSFMEKGIVHRYAIAIDGYHRIAADVFGASSREAWHMRRVIANEYPFTVMFFTRVHCRDQGRRADIPELDRLVRKAWSDPTLRNLRWKIGYWPVFDSLYELVRRTYKAMRRRGWVPDHR